MAKVIIGMSGGVDSSVAALKLLEAGHHVEGLFMKNWEQDDTEDFCPARQDMEDALAVCEKLGIKLHLANFAQEYWDRVFSHFLAEYQAGRTPNPDILCNSEIKFKAFLQLARSYGADFMATGHYVRRFDDAQGIAHMYKGLDPNKDQSYFLTALSQQQFASALFPIGDLPKPQVRALAEQAGLITAEKKDSTGICFIGEQKFITFLQRFIPAQPGDMVDENGQKVGEHQGLMYYTLGQRKGLGIGGKSGQSHDPWYVADKNLATNALMVVQGDFHPALYHQYLEASAPNWICGFAPQNLDNLKAKVRYRQSEQPCKIIEMDTQRLVVRFDASQKAITPGQSIVFYQGEECLGGAQIEKRWNA